MSARNLVDLNYLVNTKRLGSKSTVERLWRERDMPQPIKVGGRNKWVEQEIDSWIDAKLAARSVAANDDKGR
ncbi:MAG: helix-turn-helix transcriptional regulator [Burkholderiaceae bacterium]